ncbi:hypothetical protein [Marinagarivorans algicola]|uniref:hypothetical protein n=1 Tax=Marinagarivorans algicola TaxID=1513270 RepID=UPI0006B61FBE|nr:hypothetical protein [Marinagarivorans algicola]
MTEVYLLQNSENLFLNKRQEWVDGSEAASLYRTPLKDDAINTKVEITVKAPDARITIIVCTLDDKGLPSLPSADTEEAQ